MNVKLWKYLYLTQCNIILVAVIAEKRRLMYDLGRIAAQVQFKYHFKSKVLVFKMYHPQHNYTSMDPCVTVSTNPCSNLSLPLSVRTWQENLASNTIMKQNGYPQALYRVYKYPYREQLV